MYTPVMDKPEYLFVDSIRLVKMMRKYIYLIYMTYLLERP